MKLKALHLFLILLASLIFCSCLGHLSVEGMSGSRRNGDTVKSSVSDSIKDSVSDSIKGFRQGFRYKFRYFWYYFGRK